MSNHAHKPKVFAFQEFIDEREAETAIPFTMPNGETFTIPGPDFWPDRLPNAVREGFDALGRAILGDDDWDRFVAAGGKGRALNAFYAWAVEQRQGATPGESEASDVS